MLRYSLLLLLGFVLMGCGTSSQYPGDGSPTTSAPTYSGDKNTEAAIRQMSEMFSIPEDRIRAMSVLEQAALANKFLSIKLGKTSEEVKHMSPSGRHDAMCDQLAVKYGLTPSEVRSTANILKKMDAGQSLSASEAQFLQDLSGRMR